MEVVTVVTLKYIYFVATRITGSQLSSHFAQSYRHKNSRLSPLLEP